MIFFVVLALATAGAAVAFRNLRTAARWGFGIAMVVAGAAHVGNPLPFEQHLPDWVPAGGALVAVTGVIEIALGVALMAARSRRHVVGLVTAAYLAAVFPANVYVAVAGVDVDGLPGGIYPWVRLPFQALFIAWALWSTGGVSGGRARPSLPARERTTAREPSPAGSV